MPESDVGKHIPDCPGFADPGIFMIHFPDRMQEPGYRLIEISQQVFSDSQFRTEIDSRFIHIIRLNVDYPEAELF